jgi:hypothetical protein
MGSISIPTIAAVGSEAAADGAAAGSAAAAAAASSSAVLASAGAASTVAAAGGTVASVAGGAGSIFTIGNAAAAIGALGSLTSAYGAHQQGAAQSTMDKQKARVEALSATQKQIDMRQKLLASLASQNAGTLGSVGTGRGSGFGANAMRQITQNQNDLMANSANASAQVSLLDQGAANAAASGNIGAGTDVLGGTSGFLKNANI